MKLHPVKQALDILSPYDPVRLQLLKSFWVLDDKEAWGMLRRGLCYTFDAIYTGKKTSLNILNILDAIKNKRRGLREVRQIILARILVDLGRTIMPLIALVLFHKSHKEGYNAGDVAPMFGCTSACHLYASMNRLRYLLVWPQEVAQYSLIGFFMKKHDSCRELLPTLLRFVAGLMVLNWKYSDSILKCFYSMDPVGGPSSSGIINLVRRHLEAGWEKHIANAATYRKFNDRRGRMALERHGCDSGLLRSSLLAVPFDESVLLWHMATDLCFYDCRHDDAPGPGAGGAAWCAASRHHQKAARCREMSNYMVHLLCENPQMLMVGARRHLFDAAYAELCKIFRKESTPRDEKELAQRIIGKAVLPQPVDPEEASSTTPALSLKRCWLWVIEGVWVEMLCFSAGRCRGYLHAKALGTGGEFLNYVWLLKSYMGMETLAERMQRAELPSAGGDAGGDAPTTDEIVIIEGVV
ncbi:hypothetical protein C2845_PM03G06140 [Panicum miliaceum]|uniref:DUF4220 domain-containing protein n=1 Tax=Panicum miliaceum TaxID=4540 RepID=A0A3L6TC73_PANMI|nr:hypothetical protein C2845_PM03G06140 [Panicum miliaceum]